MSQCRYAFQISALKVGTACKLNAPKDTTVVAREGSQTGIRTHTFPEGVLVFRRAVLASDSCS